jgi:hypothetical protein
MRVRLVASALFTLMAFILSGRALALVPSGNVTVALPLVGTAPGACAEAAPVPVTPSNGARLDTLIPSLQWEVGQVTGVETYAVQVSPNPEFTVSVYSGAGLVRSDTITIAFRRNLQPDTTYYSRARFGCGSKNG